MKLFEINSIRNITSACCICLDDNDNVLLGLSTHDDDRNGKWCFPGGGLKGGESPENGAERECFEETGYKSYAIDNHFINPQRPNVGITLCRKINGSMKPNSEFVKLKWFSVNEILQDDDIYQPNLWTILKVFKVTT